MMCPPPVLFGYIPTVQPTPRDGGDSVSSQLHDGDIVWLATPKRPRHRKKEELGARPNATPIPMSFARSSATNHRACDGASTTYSRKCARRWHAPRLGPLPFLQIERTPLLALGKSPRKGKDFGGDIVQEYVEVRHQRPAYLLALPDRPAFFHAGTFFRFFLSFLSFFSFFSFFFFFSFLPPSTPAPVPPSATADGEVAVAAAGDDDDDDDGSSLPSGATSAATTGSAAAVLMLDACMPLKCAERCSDLENAFGFQF